MISLIQHFEADFLWKVSLKILNSGIILKTFTHEDMILKKYTMYMFTFCNFATILVFSFLPT